VPVVDASIAVKWFVEEPDSLAARELLQTHAAGTSALVAPDLLVYEVANVLLHNPRFSPSEVRLCIEQLYAVELELVAPSADVVTAAVSLAAAKRLSFYDALYVQLAHHLGLPLLTADQKLLAKLRDPRIKPL
jgi:predicted nucleic acid-binding protein